MRAVNFGGMSFILRDSEPKLFASDRAAFFQVCIANEYEDLLSTLRDGDFVLDLGANIGCFTLLASKRVGPEGRVVAVEPDPWNARQLRLNISANRVSNARVEERAIGLRSGDAVPWGGYGVFAGVSDIGEMKVTTITLKDLLGDSEGSLPHSMKIDIEGAEESLLGDSTFARYLTSTRSAAIELHSRKAFNALQALTSELGLPMTEVLHESDYLLNIVAALIRRPFLPFALYGRELLAVAHRVAKGAARRTDRPEAGWATGVVTVTGQAH